MQTSPNQAENPTIDHSQGMNTAQFDGLMNSLTDPATKRLSPALINILPGIDKVRVVGYLISQKRPIIVHFASASDHQRLTDAGYVSGYHNDYYAYWIRPDQHGGFRKNEPEESAGTMAPEQTGKTDSPPPTAEKQNRSSFQSDLHQAIDAEMEPEPGETKSESADAPENADEYPGEITAKDLLNRRVESIPCLIEPIFQAVGLAALAGSSDVGKSAFLRQLAWAVSTGQTHFLGWTIRSKHRSAIYASSEDDENATAFLLYSLNKTQHQHPDNCDNLRFIFETHDLLKELDKRLTNRPADLVVIDAFGDLFTGDANKTNQIRQFLHDYSQLAQKHECLVLWLHHTGKRTDDEAPSKHNVIGGQGFEGKMRLLIELRRDHHDNTRRHLCIVKGNYLPDEYKNESYVLSFENFLFGQTGERVAFNELVKPKEQSDAGQERYDQIQAARREGHKGDALAKHLGWSKGYISQIEKRYAPKMESDHEFTESLAD